MGTLGRGRLRARRMAQRLSLWMASHAGLDAAELRERPTDRSWARETGWEDVDGAGLFDEQWYRRTQAPELPTNVDALWHYASYGDRDGTAPSRWFSPRWYLQTYPDVAASGAPPLLHYLQHGAAEGRDPGPHFSTSAYLRANPDVRAAGLNPLGHFLVTGAVEGRLPASPSRASSSGVIVLVSGEPDTPGHRYRVDRLAVSCEQLGYDTEVLDVPQAASARLAAVEKATVLVLWRVAWGEEVERIVGQARRAQVPIVFDVDDLMIDPSLATVDKVDGIRSQSLTEQEAADWFARMGRTASASDSCTCTTERIALTTRLLGKPTHVIPNGVDDVSVVRSSLARRARDLTESDGRVRIGYAAGSRTHQKDLAVVADALVEVLTSHPEARLVLFRDSVDLGEFPGLGALGAQVEWRELVAHEHLPAELARFDINIAPLEVGNPFCEAKSDLKFFEAALVGVPTVASPTGPFQEAISNGEDGYLASSTDDWQRILTRLVEDAALRDTIGRRARDRVVRERGELDRLRRVDLWLENIGGGRRAARGFALARTWEQLGAAAQPPMAPSIVGWEADRLQPSMVTVVVPVHNYAEVLLTALDSVAAQTLTPIDLIVVDDASTDDSAAVAEEWLKQHADRFGRSVLLHHPHNAGVACARNAGFSAATTPYVLTLDADNSIEPECCERLLETAQATGASAVYPRIRHFGQSTALMADDVSRGYLPYDPQRLVGSNWIDAMALIRVDAWAMAGGYQKGLLGWEDYDLWCRFAELGLPIVQVPEDLARYRVHEASMLHTLTGTGADSTSVRAAITERHPWLRLTPDPEPGAPTPQQVLESVPAVPPRLPPQPTPEPEHRDAPGVLSDRARELLPLLRCPTTGEPLVELPGLGLTSVPSGIQWPVMGGIPLLDIDRREPVVHSTTHAGNPLPDRARTLLQSTEGRALHLSGGGTAAGFGAIELDLDIYRPTDLVANAHRLPFADNTFSLVLALNAFEHYREPSQVVAEIRRVLKPGGLVFVHTAFLQPVHEAPHHYFNVTRWGLEQWFADFTTIDLTVSSNFHPGFTLGWLASEAVAAIGGDEDSEPHAVLLPLASLWRDPGSRQGNATWEALARLRGSDRERLAAGFEYIGQAPGGQSGHEGSAR